MPTPTYDDLCEVCEELGVSFARIEFDPLDSDGIPEPPFFVLMPQYGGSYVASNAVVADLRPYDLELYTRGSDMALEASVREKLKEHGFTYQPSSVPIGDHIIKSTWSLFVRE